jgi:hypothetical protein
MVGSAFGEFLHKIEVPMKWPVQIQIDCDILDMFLKEVEDTVKVMLAGVGAIEYRLSSYIYETKFVEGNAELPIWLTVLFRVGEWNISETHHFLMDFMGPVEEMDSVVIKKEPTRGGNS